MSQYEEFAYIYDELINSDIDYKKWADKILEICEKLNLERNDYLDLACGTGNMTLELSRYFKNTWAVDLSSQMLTKAEEKLRALKIKAKFICQDISKLNLNRKFDLITCCLDSTNYIIEENDLNAYFNSVYNHLKNNGIFIFDINSYYKLINILGNNTFTFDNDNVVYIWDNFTENDIVQMNLIFFIKEDNLYKRFDEEHIEKAYTTNYLDNLLKNIGFKIVEKLNNYENLPIDDECERIVYVLKKN
ncbi:MULTISPECIES: class I SAM-dependent DNA methyltransferase [Clostridium]|uniref:class I SAM-dependent DNA methyltransferase n=1 Tax=Clostridium TaxID=1485 RepID=UPI00099AEF2E|nr:MULTISPECIES: class I SAM-dependent methyltransferase [Clostridium]